MINDSRINEHSTIFNKGFSNAYNYEGILVNHREIEMEHSPYHFGQE